MFIIPNIMVDDKKLADVLRALTGKVLSMEPPQVVLNAKMKGGKVVEETSGTTLELFAEWLAKNKIKALSRNHVRDFLELAGKAPSYVNGFTHQAMQAGIIKGSGKRGEYVVPGKSTKRRK